MLTMLPKNFIRLEDEEKEGMNSPAITNNFSRHFTILGNILSSKNNQRFYIRDKGKAKEE